MSINLDLIGKRSKLDPYTYNHDKVILYALSVGAGIHELDFLYEKNLQVLPTFAILPFMQGLKELKAKVGLNMHHTLQIGHEILFHEVIPTSGTLYSTAVLKAVYDKGDKGAIIHVDVDSQDEDGRHIFRNRFTALDRKGGNFGGPPGLKMADIELPTDAPADFTVEYTTSPEQAALYRLNGDKNPLHIDPEFSQMLGLKRPILHGLCTCGFAVRAILHSICGGEARRLKSFSTWFRKPVFPGDTLVVKGWQIKPGKYGIQTKTQDGHVVLDHFVAEIKEDKPRCDVKGPS